MSRSGTFQLIADLAEEQWGLFTRRQAEATGMAWSTLARLSRDGVAERVAHGVYRLRGTAADDRLPLRAAWLQLAPDVPSWLRTPAQGVVSHRSAAFAYDLGHLPADVHDFVLPIRRQSRRPDVRLHRAMLGGDDVRRHEGLWTVRAARIVTDLISDVEDPGAVAQIVAGVLRQALEDPTVIAGVLAPHATRLGLGADDGVALLDWLLDLAAAPERARWVAEAQQRP